MDSIANRVVASIWGISDQNPDVIDIVLNYFQTSNQVLNKTVESIPCPCCGYPTISGKKENEICYLCKWRTGGRYDPLTDEVWGFGPNENCTLSVARFCFKKLSHNV